jgi:ABC-type transporter Mla MlaB component
MAAPGASRAALRITSTRRPPGLAISGEIDETTYGDLVGALGTFADGLAEVHLGLAGVEYCDLAGLRAILRPARGNGQIRCVVLHDVPPHLREVLRILGWDATPGLTIDQRPWHPRRVPATTRTLADVAGLTASRLRNSLIPRRMIARASGETGSAGSQAK